MTYDELRALGEAWSAALSPDMGDWAWGVHMSALGTFWQMYINANPEESHDLTL